MASRNTAVDLLQHVFQHIYTVVLLFSYKTVTACIQLTATNLSSSSSSSSSSPPPSPSPSSSSISHVAANT
jgi:hypothetical protein